MKPDETLNPDSKVSTSICVADAEFDDSFEDSATPVAAQQGKVCGSKKRLNQSNVAEPSTGCRRSRILDGVKPGPPLRRGPSDALCAETRIPPFIRGDYLTVL